MAKGNNKPRVFGVTGGIGSGKSTVCKILEGRGYPVYYADHAAKQLMSSHPPLIAAIKKLFGEEAYQGSQLNRQFIASQAFQNPAKLQQLNETVHPIVAKDFNDWCEQHRHESVLFKEAALIFETGGHKQLAGTWLVVSPESLRISRVIVRDPQRTEEDVKSIIAKQMPEHEKEKLASFIIHNTEDRPIIPQVLRILEQMDQS